MSIILMCKNQRIYNVDTEYVYNEALLPGYMVKSPCKYTFKHWLKLRYSSNTNSLARQLKGITFGQGNRVRINKETRAFSLSDSYWLKDEKDMVLFEQCSPYYSDFWKGKGEYKSGMAVPTLYVSGCLHKEWINRDLLAKYGGQTIIEYECSRICSLVGIPCNKVQILPDKSGIAVSNITNADYMLEQADMSDRIDPDDFDNNVIIKLFGIDGLYMLFVDAVFGNGDRHAGNFGWLRSTDTGKYISMAPLYDFDHALDGNKSSDILITDFVDTVKSLQNRQVIENIKSKTQAIISNTINDVFKQRARTILQRL